VWHSHDDTDEVFIVLGGAGEMFVIPLGIEHQPFARSECRMMLVEPAGTVNTGGVRSALTAQDGVWV